MGIELRITDGRGEGKSFIFDQEIVRVGRLPDNDLVLYDTGVSRYHFEVIEDGDGYTLRDAGSSNGTLLNDVITTEARLRPGDRIGVGPITFNFGVQDPASQTRRDRNQSLSRPEDEEERKALEEFQTSAYRREDISSLKRLREGRAVDAVSVVRTATGSFMAYPNAVGGRLKSLPRSTRIALVSATAIVVAAAVGAAYIIKMTPPEDRSSEVFAMGGRTAEKRFGDGPVSVYTPDRASFRFIYGGGLVVLRYAAWGVESEKELSIMANGEHVAFVKKTDRWSQGLTLEIPRKLLRSGENIITFDNTFTPKRREPWAVGQVVVNESPVPPADPAKARELFKLGRAAFDVRSVAPHNLYRSIGYFEQAALYLEAADPSPPLYGRIREMLRESRRELITTHEQHVFSARKAMRFGDNQVAVETLRNLLRYYPDPEDRRHVEVKSLLGEALSGKSRR